MVTLHSGPIVLRPVRATPCFYAFATRLCQQKHLFSGCRVPRSPGRVLLPQYLINGSSSLDETYREYSLGLVTPRGAGVPPSAFAASLSIHFLIFCSLLLFPFFLFSFTLLIFLYCPSDPFLPELSHSVSRREVVGGDRTWV